MPTKHIAAIAAVALAGGVLLSGCDSEPHTCAPSAMGAISLQSFDMPLAPGSGGGSGGGGGRGPGGGSGGSSSGRSGGSSSGGGSYGGNKSSGGSSSSGGGGYRAPASAPDRGYRPAPGQPAPTYVQQPDHSWMPFIGGVLVGNALSDPPAGCR